MRRFNVEMAHLCRTLIAQVGNNDSGDAKVRRAHIPTYRWLSRLDTRAVRNSSIRVARQPSSVSCLVAWGCVHAGNPTDINMNVQKTVEPLASGVVHGILHTTRRRDSYYRYDYFGVCT